MNKSTEVHETVREVLARVRYKAAQTGPESCGGSYAIAHGHVTISADDAGRLVYSVRRCSPTGWQASPWRVLKARPSRAAYGRAVAMSLIGV